MSSFSLRRHIVSQAPGMSEKKIREHLSFCQQTLLAFPDLDLRKYRVSPEGVRDNG